MEGNRLPGEKEMRDNKNQSRNKLYNTVDISVHAEPVEAWPYLTLRQAQGERLQGRFVKFICLLILPLSLWERAG